LLTWLSSDDLLGGLEKLVGQVAIHEATAEDISQSAVAIPTAATSLCQNSDCRNSDCQNRVLYPYCNLSANKMVDQSNNQKSTNQETTIYTN